MEKATLVLVVMLMACAPDPPPVGTTQRAALQTPGVVILGEPGDMLTDAELADMGVDAERADAGDMTPDAALPAPRCSACSPALSDDLEPGGCTLGELPALAPEPQRCARPSPPSRRELAQQRIAEFNRLRHDERYLAFFDEQATILMHQAPSGMEWSTIRAIDGDNRRLAELIFENQHQTRLIYRFHWQGERVFLSYREEVYAGEDRYREQYTSNGRGGWSAWHITEWPPGVDRPHSESYTRSPDGPSWYSRSDSDGGRSWWCGADGWLRSLSSWTAPIPGANVGENGRTWRFRDGQYHFYAATSDHEVDGPTISPVMWFDADRVLTHRIDYESVLTIYRRNADDQIAYADVYDCSDFPQARWCQSHELIDRHLEPPAPLDAPPTRRICMSESCRIAAECR